MPLTLRPKTALLDSILSHLLAGNIVTDISEISVVRQLCEGVAATQADLDYDLYTMLQSWYLTTAEGVDLRIRGRDLGYTDPGSQAASGRVLFTKTTAWIDDIALPAPQVVQATLPDGAPVLYRSIEDLVMRPSGRSVSGPIPGTSLTAGTNDQLVLNLDGDGPRTLTLGTLTSAVAIAAQIQAQVRALTPNNLAHSAAYTDFRADFGVTNTGLYTLRAGTAGPSSSVIVTVAGTHDASAILKLGVTQGGLEAVGMGELSVPVVCDRQGVIGNVGAGRINQIATQIPGLQQVANPLAFANGRETASDNAYRQDVRSHLLALGPGTEDALEAAVYSTVGDDGLRHVMSAQAVYGAGTIQVYVCDGQSLTVGAQSEVIKDVQDELDGLGQRPGGWIPSGNSAGVASAVVLPVPVTVFVTLGPTPDLVRAQAALANAVYQMLYTWPVGFPLSYSQMSVRLNATVAEVIETIFTLPGPWSLNPPQLVGGGIGVKLMPGTIVVNVGRA